MHQRLVRNSSWSRAVRCSWTGTVTELEGTFWTSCRLATSCSARLSLCRGNRKLRRVLGTLGTPEHWEHMQLHHPHAQLLASALLLGAHEQLCWHRQTTVQYGVGNGYVRTCLISVDYRYVRTCLISDTIGPIPSLHRFILLTNLVVCTTVPCISVTAILLSWVLFSLNCNLFKPPPNEITRRLTKRSYRLVAEPTVPPDNVISSRLVLHLRLWQNYTWIYYYFFIQFVGI